MGVAEELDALRAELSGCHLVAYADLQSRLVLCASSAGNPAQEELDALSRAANLALDGNVAEGAKPLWAADTGNAPASSAMLMTGQEVRMFLRSPGNAPEALIVVAEAGADMAILQDRAGQALGRIAALEG